MEEESEFVEQLAKELELRSAPTDFAGMRREIRKRLLELHPDRHGGQFASPKEEKLFGFLNLARGYLDKLLKSPPKPPRPSGPACSEDFKELVGNTLSGITFVMDYLQLQFNPPPTLNVYTPISVQVGTARASFGEAPFANLALSQIGKEVKSVVFSLHDAMTISFVDGSAFVISLKEQDYDGPEAINYFGPGNEFVVA